MPFEYAKEKMILKPKDENYEGNIFSIVQIVIKKREEAIRNDLIQS